MARRKQLIDGYNVDLVLDVGGNYGQYAELLRSIGYRGRIISFEPLAGAFAKLEAAASSDPLWETIKLALGDENCTTCINVSGNSKSSSICDMLPAHEKAAPSSKYIGTETTVLKKLDSIFNEVKGDAVSPLLKIDTQGFEKKIISGAEKSLKHIPTLQIEMSTVPLYKDEVLFDEMCAYLKDKGYELVSIEAGFTDPESGRMLQFDGIFHNYEI